jgi:hypothetical protein
MQSVKLDANRDVRESEAGASQNVLPSMPGHFYTKEKMWRCRRGLFWLLFSAHTSTDIPGASGERSGNKIHSENLRIQNWEFPRPNRRLIKTSFLTVNLIKQLVVVLLVVEFFDFLLDFGLVVPGNVIYHFSWDQKVRILDYLVSDHEVAMLDKSLGFLKSLHKFQ